MTKGDLAGFNIVWSLLSARLATAAITALNLCLDATTVGSCADGWQVWTNGLDQATLHGRVGVVESCLDDIVRKGVAEKSVELSGLQHLLNQHVLGRLLGTTEALLNDVGTELLLRELGHTTLELGNQRLGEDRLIQIEDILDNVIAKGVLDQRISIVRDLSDEPSLLISRGMINAALKDAAAMTVSAYINAVVANRIKDELSIVRSELVKTLLDDVVAVQVLDELHNSIAKSRDDSLNLTRCGDELNHLLKGAGSMLVKSNANEILGGIFDENSALFIVAELEELLAEIVPEGIGHQLDDMLVGFKPDHVDLLRIALLQLLLKVSAAVLILAKSIDLTTKLLKRHVCETVHS